MNAHIRREEVRALRMTRQDIADLIQRYPNVSEEETAQIVTYLRKGRHLDVGILTGDERLKPKLDRFMADHRKHFRLGFGEATAVIAAITGFLLVFWLIWEAMRASSI